MKQYGPNKATEFTAKQIGVIYRVAKNGDLKIENWVVKEFYRLADYYGYDDNKSVEKSETEIKNILDAVFAQDLTTAQQKIDEYTKKNFELLSNKSKQAADRNYL